MGIDMIILDTCVLIYWTLDPSKLSKKAEKLLNNNDIGISSISIWEIGIKTLRKKLILPLSIEAYSKKLKKVDRVTIIPVDEKIWIDNINLNWSHKDPADRTIVATAKALNSPLLTSDKRILKFYKKAVWK